MANKPSKTDTSTICDLICKEWSDRYPSDKVSSLKTKADSLTYSIETTKELLARLEKAKGKLSILYTALQPLFANLEEAISQRNEFIQTYGPIGNPLSIPHETMEATLKTYRDALAEYADSVQTNYFANLDEAKETLAALAALRYFYNTLAEIPVTIREAYFKTSADRRKPIIRDLFRRFKLLAESSLSNPQKLIKQPLPQEEFDSLMAVRAEAAKAADTIKRSR